MIDIENLAKVLHYYNLYEPSSKYKIVCPFHNDVNASLLINLDEGRYFCFGCNRNGGALEFVKDANPVLNDLEAMKLYYKILHSKKVAGITYNKQVNIKKQKKEKALEQVIAKDYYFNLKTINWYKVKDEDLDIRDYMLNRGFQIKTLNRCKAKLTYNPSYPIIFPMNDMGEFRGWVCRTNVPEIESKRKYLYNKGFSRASTLVGRYDNSTVVLVEGYMDYLKMKQFGLKYVAAILGWKITSQQIMKLKDKGVKNIVSALDTDDCGQKGTKYLEKHFNVVRFQFPETIKDPGDLNKKTFKEAVEKTKKLGGITNECNW